MRNRPLPQRAIANVAEHEFIRMICISLGVFGSFFTSYNAMCQVSTTGFVPLYRLQKENEDFLTTDCREKTNAIQMDNFTDMGILGYVSVVRHDGMRQLYRWKDDTHGRHLFSNVSWEGNTAGGGPFIFERTNIWIFEIESKQGLPLRRFKHELKHQYDVEHDDEPLPEWLPGIESDEMGRAITKAARLASRGFEGYLGRIAQREEVSKEGESCQVPLPFYVARCGCSYQYPSNNVTFPLSGRSEEDLRSQCIAKAKEIGTLCELGPIEKQIP